MSKLPPTAAARKFVATAAAAKPPATMASWIPGILLAGLLLILAVRLSVGEVPIETFSQIAERVAPPADTAPMAPEPGPGAIIGLALLTLLLAGAAAGWCGISRQAGILLALIGLILVCATASTFHAANHFAALVGTFDIAMALLGGWAIMLLATTEARRRLVLAVLLAVLSAWVAKGLYQRFLEIPDTISYYHEHKQEIWKQHGWTEGDYHITLFEGRMNSQEVTGFSAYSNVTAQGMLPLALLTLALLIAAARVKAKGSWENIPTTLLCAVALALLLGLAGIVLVLTQSKGASAALVLFAVLLGAGLWFRNGLQRHWRRVALAVLVAWIAGTFAVVAYGMRHDGLPSRSLLFRWHYWTASVPIVQSSPQWGVGLYNFGDYYLTYKRPSSPEDVKDPHSFFVRIAAELGLPAAGLFALLLIAWFYAGARAQAGWGARTQEPGMPIPSPARSSMLTTLLTGGVFCALWFLARMALNERLDMPLPWLLNTLFAGMAFGGFLLADATCRHAPSALRSAGLAILSGALAMLLYDQINVGLVTGPVAMLFWSCLGYASAQTPEDAPPNRAKLALGISSSMALAAGVLAVAVWIPVVQGTLAWDARPVQQKLIEKLTQRASVDELALLDAALQRQPRSIELRHRRIVVKAHRGQSVAQDIRDLLALDPCDMQLHLAMARLPSDWPAAERRAALQKALWLDSQLEPHEPKRLTPGERQAVEAEIVALKVQRGMTNDK